MACLVEFPAIEYLNAITERYFQDLSRFKESVFNLQLKYAKLINERDMLQSRVNTLLKTEEDLKRQISMQDASISRSINTTSSSPADHKTKQSEQTLQLEGKDSDKEQLQNQFHNPYRTSVGESLTTPQFDRDETSEDNFFLENPRFLDKFIRDHVTKDQLEHWLEEKTRVAVVLDRECQLNANDKANERTEGLANRVELDSSNLQSDAASEWRMPSVGNSLVHHDDSTGVLMTSRNITTTFGDINSWPRPTPVQKKTLALGGNIKIPAGRDMNTICRLCGKQFSSSSVRNRHMLSHSGHRPHKCDICGKGFILASHLKGHLGTHFKREVFKCRLCQRELKSSEALEEHMRQHKGGQRYTCEICGEQFQLASEIEKHMQVHSVERPFKCDICGNQYNEIGSLKRHCRVHADEQPDSLNHCGTEFTFSANMSGLEHSDPVAKHELDITKQTKRESVQSDET